MVTKVRSTSVYFIALLISTFPVHGQSQIVYWIESIEPTGEATLHTYKESEIRKNDLPSIQVWEQKIGTQDPMHLMYWTREPDITYELLRSGYARLRDERSATQIYKEAQFAAKNARLGMWNLPHPKPDWERLLTLYGGIGAVLAGLSAVLAFVLQIYRRRKVPLLFLGPSSVGKTWLWARIRDADISHDDLMRLDRTDVTMRESASEALPMGRYEVKPIYIDTPGGQQGWQASELLRKHWLFPRRVVWILLLSTTRLKAASRNSRDDEKIDRDYVSEQLGYLYLPLGFLAAPKAQKPSLVITVISKFDLFSERDPTTPEARPAKDQLESNVFGRHIAMIREECKRARVDFKLEHCSALNGWRTESINRHIRQVLFRG